MPTNRVIRASDRDREQVVEILRAHYAEGRLTLEEFDERTTAAYAGKTWGDLLDLIHDLPADVRLGADLAVTGQAVSPRARASLPPRLVPLVPLLIAGLILVSFAGGSARYPGHHHYLTFISAWPLVVLVLLLLLRGGRRHPGGPDDRQG